MKINQLFKTHIPEEILNKILKCFGYDDVNACNEQCSFCKADLARLGTVENVNLLKDEIAKHYLPCKSKIYLHDLDSKKCITILRQVLKLHGFTLLSKQKYVKQKKTTFYYIQKKTLQQENSGFHHMSLKIENEPKILTFL